MHSDLIKIYSPPNLDITRNMPIKLCSAQLKVPPGGLVLRISKS